MRWELVQVLLALGDDRGRRSAYQVSHAIVVVVALAGGIRPTLARRRAHIVHGDGGEIPRSRAALVQKSQLLDVFGAHPCALAHDLPFLEGASWDDGEQTSGFLKRPFGVMHQAVVVVWTPQRVHKDLLIEVTHRAGRDVLRNYADVRIPVRAGLLVPEPQGVEYLVYHLPLVLFEATPTQVHIRRRPTA
jgi:hypothetical protein